MAFLNFHPSCGNNRRTLLATLVLLASAMLPACSKPPAHVVAAPPPVKVVLAKSEDVPVDLTNIGIVQSVASVTLETQVDGIINAVLVKPGAKVRKGQILFTLDNRPFVAALLQAQANLAQAQANVLVAQAKLDGYQAAYVDAAADWQRAQKMGITSGALAITQFDAYHSTFDQAKANVANGKASLVAARKAVDSAKANVTTAQINLGYCTVRSPLDGKAGNLQAFVGSNVKATTTNLLVINQMQPIYVSFSLPQSDLYQIRKAQQTDSKLPVYVRAHGDPGPPSRGFLSFVDNAIDDSTGSIQLMGTFANTHEELWPGEFVNATLQVAVQKHAVVVPIQAVQTGQNGVFVFVVQNHVARMQSITEKFSYNGMAVISKGLSAGETVVTDGQENVISGQRVEVVTKGLIAPAASASQASADQPDAHGGSTKPATKPSAGPATGPVTKPSASTSKGRP